MHLFLIFLASIIALSLAKSTSSLIPPFHPQPTHYFCHPNIRIPSRRLFNPHHFVYTSHYFQCSTLYPDISTTPSLAIAESRGCAFWSIDRASRSSIHYRSVRTLVGPYGTVDSDPISVARIANRFGVGGKEFRWAISSERSQSHLIRTRPQT